MVSAAHIMDTSWTSVTILTFINGALSVVLLSKQTKIDVALIIFTVFEWISSIISTIRIASSSKSLSNFAGNNIKYLNIFNVFCVLASTTVGIYWIDNIILENVTASGLYLRQLKLSFVTLFMISLLFKSIILINILPINLQINNNSNETSIHSDLESVYATTDKESSSNIPSMITQSIPSTKQSVLKFKDSLQTLVSKPSKKSLDVQEKKEQQEVQDIVNENHNHLNLKFAELFKVPSRCETTETTDISNTTPNRIAFPNTSLPNISFKQPQMLAHNIKENNIPSTPIVTVLTNHITEEDLDNSVPSVLMKPSSFQFPKEVNQQIAGLSHPNYNFILDDNAVMDDYEEDRDIQMLNISEPIHMNDFSQSVRTNNKALQNISLKTWNERSEQLMNKEAIFSQNLYMGINKGNILNPQPDLQPEFQNQYPLQFKRPYFANTNIGNNDLDVQSFSTDSDNCLFDELKKEIRENGTHQSQIQIQQSMPNIRFASRQNSVIYRGGSFSKVIRGSMSSSNINAGSIRNKPSVSSLNLNLTHQKSNSLSAISMSKTKSRSRSHSPLKRFRSFKDSLQLTPRTPKQTRESSPVGKEDFELDLNLANSIRKSPKKKSSSRSITSKSTIRRISMASPSRNDNMTQLQDLSSSSPINFGGDLSLSLGEISPSMLAKTRDYPPANKQEHYKSLADEFIIQNRIKNQRIFSAVSSTDKSSISNTSVPSGYYGEYDKEKWRVFKKVQNDQFLPSPLTTTP